MSSETERGKEKGERVKEKGERGKEKGERTVRAGGGRFFSGCMARSAQLCTPLWCVGSQGFLNNIASETSRSDSPN